MNLKQRINAFSKLGDFLSQFSTNGIKKKEGIAHNDLFFDGFRHQIKIAKEHNGWFTQENILFALEGWSSLLNKKTLELWLQEYVIDALNDKQVAIIMAGNIPLVGFHDFFICINYWAFCSRQNNHLTINNFSPFLQNI